MYIWYILYSFPLFTSLQRTNYRPIPGDDTTPVSKEAAVPVCQASWKIHWKIKKIGKRMDSLWITVAKYCGKLKSIPNSTTARQVTHTMLFTSNYSGQDLRWLILGEVKISYLASNWQGIQISTFSRQLSPPTQDWYASSKGLTSHLNPKFRNCWMVRMTAEWDLT